MKRTSTQYITQAALIAAVYAALTLALAPISYMNIQLRVAEAMTVLPAIFPSAIPGLFVGCILANTLGPGAGVLDIIFGSLATLLAAWLSYKLRKHTYLVPLPPVIVNAVIIGAVLSYAYNLPLALTMLQVGAGQLLACYGIGLPLLFLVKKIKKIKDGNIE